MNRNPRSYIDIEQDKDASELAAGYLNGQNQTCITGSADQTGLADESATMVYGEAMLTMLSDRQKSSTMQEAHRILQINGRYGIHEMCLVPDDLSESFKETIQKELSSVIRVNARPLTINEWRERLVHAGFHVTAHSIAPMHLLKLHRMVNDEGFRGTFKIIYNCLTRSSVRKRAASPVNPESSALRMCAIIRL